MGPGPQVDVWLVRPSPVADALLDGPERARAAAFRRPEDRVAYVAAHTALRALVGRRLGVAPGALAFAHQLCPLCGERHGRPVVVGGGVEFSLSRTAGRLAVALSPAVVGVDVEASARPVTLDDLTTALHPAERRVTEGREVALRRWVRKEAYLKALGTGLGLDPATVDLTSDPPGWRILDVPTGAAAAGPPATYAAVAVATPPGAPAPTLTVTESDLSELLPTA